MDNYNFKKRLKAYSLKKFKSTLMQDDSYGQATKSARGMPWHWEPTKDATNCDKPRGAVSEH